jgi:polysaccharide pyruvyl transferase WcaK-like protein
VFVGGWAAHRHVGDDAILRVHLDELRRRQLPVDPVILGNDPTVLAERFGARASLGLERFMLGEADESLGVGVPINEAQRLAMISAVPPGGRAGLAPLDVRRVRNELDGATALIVLGAGSLATKFAPSLWTQTATVEIARALGVPVAVAGAALGPVSNPLDAMFLRRLLHGADLVCIRDRVHSLALAQKLGIEDVVPEWDPGARMTPAARASATDGGAGPPNGYAVLCATGESWQEHGATVDALYAELGLPTIGMPMDFYPGLPDIDSLRTLREQLRHPQALRILDPLPPDPSLVGLIARARVAFGSRYHMAVFATTHGTACVLVHFDAYSRQRAEGLAGLAGPPLRLCDATEGSDAVRDAVLAEATKPRNPPKRLPPLPAIEWLADQLRARSATPGVPGLPRP